MNKNPNEAKVMDHEADGIKELDNLLPRWWVWLFNLCVAFAVVYSAPRPPLPERSVTGALRRLRR